jgi:hypothetical protein
VNREDAGSLAQVTIRESQKLRIAARLLARHTCIRAFCFSARYR